jgi:hypothetical protein
MNSNQIKLLLELGDELLKSGSAHNQKTALMMYQCGANMQSSDAYLCLYKAKKITNFKNKKYPNTATQDLFAAVKQNHPGAMVIAAKENYFADVSVQYFYLKVAEKLFAQNASHDFKEISLLLQKTSEKVPTFMQTSILKYVDSWEIGSGLKMPLPICKSCSNLKRWDSPAPICSVTSSEITKFLDSCSLIKRIEIDPTYNDEVKFNMDESYNESSDDD